MYRAAGVPARDAHGALLVFDEIPTGLGKTGAALTAHACSKGRPDEGMTNRRISKAASGIASLSSVGRAQTTVAGREPGRNRR